MAHHYNKPKRFEVSNQFVSSAICDKCSIVLTTSIYKNHLMAYSTKANIRHGWLCIRCLIKEGKAKYDDLDKFLINELEKYIKPIKKSQDNSKKMTA